MLEWPHTIAEGQSAQTRNEKTSWVPGDSKYRDFRPESVLRYTRQGHLPQNLEGRTRHNHKVHQLGNHVSKHV